MQSIGGHVGRVIGRVHDIPQFVPGTGIQQIQCIVLQRRVNPRFPGQCTSPLSKRNVPHLAVPAQRQQFILKFVSPLTSRLCREVALFYIEPDRRDGRNHNHHGDHQLQSKTGTVGGVHLGLERHGKCTWNVESFFSSTGTSSVVLLLNHAFNL